MSCIGETYVKLEKNINDDLKIKIFNVFDDSYGDSIFISYIKGFDYKGDMGCLCVFGANIVRHLKKAELKSYIKEYKIINLTTNEKEDLLSEE